jgi:hypothetical protein
MINIDELPTTMPGTMKDQLLALAPFMTDRKLKMNGGFVVDMKIPIESFLTFDINHEALAEYNMSIIVHVDAPEPAFDGRIIRHARYAEATLTYK